ncbi:MAG: succinate--CoA ligase subunit beta, partial [Cellulomonadaceae bacterium]|nr:succinate--CoA ligase subunit beta [Cellulomonadaceae bacterium]
MDLFEYQARDLFARHNVPVLGGLVATTAEDARAAAADMFGITGCDVVAVKAQVKTGGRGKAGGVKIASSVAEATEAAQDILGMDIKGHTVLRVMIAQGAAIEREFYFAIMLDRASGGYLAIASTHGGMDIEQAARDHPEEVAKVPIDPLVG